LPLHLLLGRRLALRAFRFLAARAPWVLRETKEASSFVMQAQQGRVVRDSLLQHITVGRLAGWIEGAGFRRLREDRRVTGFFMRALPAPLRARLAQTPLVQDVMIGHIECVLVKP
jgi:hypothetical protein